MAGNKNSGRKAAEPSPLAESVLAIRMPGELRAAIEREAHRRGVKASSWARRVCERAVRDAQRGRP